MNTYFSTILSKLQGNATPQISVVKTTTSKWVMQGDMCLFPFQLFYQITSELSRQQEPVIRQSSVRSDGIKEACYHEWPSGEVWGRAYSCLITVIYTDRLCGSGTCYACKLWQQSARHLPLCPKCLRTQVSALLIHRHRWTSECSPMDWCCFLKYLN